MRIGDSVLGTYRRTNLARTVAVFTDERCTGWIDSHRYPLGFYWVRFVTAEGEVRQMNHETEIHGDPRQVMPKLRVLANVRANAKTHMRAGGEVQWENGMDYRTPRPVTPAEALDELAEIGQEEVIL